MIPVEEAKAILDRALSEEIGIALRVDSPKDFRQELLIAKRQLADPRYDVLVTLLPRGNEWVYICRKDAEGPLP